MTLNWQQAPEPQQTTRRVGTKATGILQVPIYGGITTDEDTEYALLLADLPSALEAAARLAEAMHVQHDGMTRVEAYAVIQGHLAGSEPEPAALELILQHAGQLEDIKRQWVREFQSRRIAAVTALLRVRLGATDETIASVRKRPRKLIEALYAIWQDEQAAEAADAAPMTEDDIKKQPPEIDPDPSDGTSSSGSCAIGTPVPSTVAPTAESSVVLSVVPTAACAPSNVSRLPLPSDPSPA